MHRYKVQQVFRDKAKSISDVAKLETSTKDSKWIDWWYLIFQKFLRSIPRGHGVPLSYIIHDNASPAAFNDSALNFLDNSVLHVPLIGDTYQTDSNEVHVNLTFFISGNSSVVARITLHRGRLMMGEQVYCHIRIFQRCWYKLTSKKNY